MADPSEKGTKPSRSRSFSKNGSSFRTGASGGDERRYISGVPSGQQGDVSVLGSRSASVRTASSSPRSSADFIGAEPQCIVVSSPSGICFRADRLDELYIKSFEKIPRWFSDLSLAFCTVIA